MERPRSVLVLKNIAPNRIFFAPLNRWVRSGEYVDLLQTCGAATGAAIAIAHHYKDHPDWQTFEVFEGPVPSPEGNIENAPADLVFDTPPNAVLVPKAAPKEESKPKPVKETPKPKAKPLDGVAH